MRKIVLYIAMSLDGYIADVDGGVGWLKGDGSDITNQGSYPRFLASIDTIIMGHKTYLQIHDELAKDNWPYLGKKCYVITHKPFDTSDDIIAYQGRLDHLIHNLKSEPGKDVWICGGVSLAQQLLELQLIDILHISIIPTIITKGIPLFANLKQQHELKFVSSTNYNGINDLVYTFK
ncbi:MAG: dihydrofolate reductase family protein [Erysipelotrichaceae bacterium]|nr:dihydrofolate reductase family protein [Erysipelotrichaceae bacterium]MDY5251867.1 dihydrofolate reductase family protein [Erysipelotrichaceae bacterium]